MFGYDEFLKVTGFDDEYAFVWVEPNIVVSAVEENLA